MIHRYSGAGNTFVLLDACSSLDKEQIQQICSSQEVDGLLQLLPSAVADARMRIFNRDGSEAEMCGNGLRCAVFHLNLPHTCHIETLAGIHSGERLGPDVSISLSQPHGLKLHLSENLHFLNTGVPHAILFTDDLEHLDVALIGKKIRESEIFAPAGTNVNFVKLEEQGLSIRTYERGVEAETLACGTGAAASALIASKLYFLPSPISVRVRSGEDLKIYFNSDWSEVKQKGPVKKMQEICQSLII